MLLELIIIFLGILGLVGYVIFYVKTNKSITSQTLDPNLPIVMNMARKQFTDGYSVGLLTKQLPRKNGCYLIEYYPLDQNQGINKVSPEVKSLIVKSGCVKRMARGESSSNREIVILTARTKKDMPEAMRTTLEADWETIESQKAFLLENFGKLISTSDRAIAGSMDDYGYARVADKIIKQNQEKKEVAEKINFQEEKKDDK